MTALVVLAAYDPNDVKPGWIAFWIVVALGVATFLLWRSMNSQLRKIKAPYKDEVDAAQSERAAQSPADHSTDGDDEDDSSGTA